MARGDGAAGVEKEAAGGLEDVGLVHQRQLAALVGLAVLEGVLDDPLAALAGDDGDALGGGALVVDVVLHAGIEPLRVLADHDQIHAGVARLDAGEAARRADIGVEIEFLAQRDVDAAIAFADGGRQRTFQRQLVAADGVERLGGNGSAVGGHRAGARGSALPEKPRAGGLDGLDGGIDHFGTDPVAGDQRDVCRHGR